MGKVAKRKGMDTIKQARQVLGLPFLKDKVICFISSWEKSNLSMYRPEKDGEYFLQEPHLFLLAQGWWKWNGDFSFVAMRDLGGLSRVKVDPERIRKCKKEFPGQPPKSKNFIDKGIYRSKMDRFLIKRSLDYMISSRILNNSASDLFGYDIVLLPADASYIGKLREMHGIVELRDIDVLCIDYDHFPSFVIYHFIRHMESKISKEPIEVRSELKPLYGVFDKLSSGVRIMTRAWINTWIGLASDNCLRTVDWDKIEFLSMNHRQNMELPSFWNNIKKNGYLCSQNVPDIKLDGRARGEEEDVRFFYSFESLLMFELKNCLKRIKRCRNCGSILNAGYKGRYCQKGSDNFKKCSAERNRKRQKKHYNLTKT